MYRLLLIFCLISSFAFAQRDAAPFYDPDFDTELNLFNRFFQAGDITGAYEHGQKMVEIANRKHLPPREQAAGEYAVGEALRRMQRLAEAETHLRRSLSLRESVLSKSHFRVLQSVDALANVLFLERKYEEAQPLLERTIASYAAIPDRDGPDECHYGQAMQNLGVMESVKKNPDKAEGLLLRATRSLALAGMGCGQLHGVFYSLAGVYWLQDRRDKVGQVYETAVRVFTPAAGEDPDYHYPYYLRYLAAVYSSEKRYDQADALYKKAMQAATHVSGREGASSDANLLADITGEYKAMLEASGRKGEVAAVEQQRRAATAVVAGDSQRPEAQFQALQRDAMQAEQEKRFADAEKDLRQAIEVGRSLGPHDGRDILAEVDLGLFLSRQKRADEGQQVMEQAWAEARQRFEGDTAVLGRVYSGLVVIYSDGHHDAALESVLKLSLDLHSKNRGDIQYPYALAALGQFYVSQRQFALAEPLYLQALQVTEQAKGPENFAVVSGVERLGYLYSQMGDWAKAEPYYRRALAMYEKQFGDSSPMLNGMLSQLAQVDRNLGRFNEANDLMARRERLNNAAPITQKQ